MTGPSPIILIDDDRALLRATSQTLELAGFVVSAFESPIEALAVIDADFPGVVVSDVLMPRIDGLGARSAAAGDPHHRAW